MNQAVQWTAAEVMPEREPVLELIGVPDEDVPEHIEALYDGAMQVLSDVAEPAGVVSEISEADFAEVYAGDGRNDPHTPVADIFPGADRLALFTVTMGEGTSAAIAKCFASHDFALGSMLDSAASAAVERAAELVERSYEEALCAGGWEAPPGAVLRYSPGYCGWHVSGQRRLFDYLEPERIGVTLRSSFLMEPLKSTSGVLIAAPQDVHAFAPTYSFCSRCETKGCRQRIRALLAR
jgi:hypothetical protein